MRNCYETQEKQYKLERCEQCHCHLNDPRDLQYICYECYKEKIKNQNHGKGE